MDIYNVDPAEGAKPIRDEDWLASLSRAALIKEAVRRNQMIVEFVLVCEQRAIGKLAAADFDKAIADLLEGDGWFVSDALLASFRKEDAA